jgi:hypothetical protein
MAKWSSLVPYLIPTHIMRSHRFHVLLAFALVLPFASCTDDDADTGITCDDLTDDAVIIDGKKLEFAPGYNVCASTDHFGAMWYTHMRDVTYGNGNTLILATLNITLSSTPAAGETKIYTINDGMWQLGTTAAADGQATFRLNNMELDPEVQENLFGDGQSGTVTAMADASGAITLNFDNVQLLNNAAERIAICGQNIICH